MIKKLKNKFFVLSAFLVLFLVCFLSFPNTVVEAQGNAPVTISCYEEDEIYYINSYIEYEGNDFSYTIYNVDGTEIRTFFCGDLNLRKRKQQYNVFATHHVVSYEYDPETDSEMMVEHTFSSQAIVLAGFDIVGNIEQDNIEQEEEENKNERIETIWKTILPIVASLAIISIGFFYFWTKRIPKIRRIKNKLDGAKTKSEELLELFKNPKIKEKVKKRKIKTYLSLTYSKTKALISTCIVLNMESMGQHASLLANLVSFEKLLAASIKTINKNSLNKGERIIKNIQSDILPKLITNAEQITLTFDKLLLNSNEFAKNLKSNKFFSSEEEYQKYLEKQVFINGDESDC